MPGADVDRRAAAGGGPAGEAALQRLEALGLGPGDDRAVAGEVVPGERAGGVVVQEAAGPGQLDELEALLLGHAPGGERAGDQRVLAGQVLAGAFQGDQQPGVAHHAAVVGGHVVVDVGGQVDQRGEAGQRLGAVELALVHGGAQGGQLAERGGEAVHALAGLLAGGAADAAVGGRALEGVAGLVGLGALGVEPGAADGGVVAQVRQRHAALVLERGDDRVGGLGDLDGEGLRAGLAEGVGEGGGGREDPQRHQCRDRGDQQQEHLRLDGTRPPRHRRAMPISTPGRVPRSCCVNGER